MMTIGSRLALGFGLASLLPLFLLASFTIYSVIEFFSETTRQSLQQKTQLIAPDYRNFLDNVAKTIKIYTQADVFETGDQLQIYKYLNEVSIEAGTPEELHYFGTDGMEVARSGAVLKGRFAITDLGLPQALFDQIRQSKQGTVLLSDIVTTRPENRYFVALSPVTDDSNLDVIGVLGMTVPISALNGLMQRVRGSLNDGQIAFVLGKDGEILVPPTPARGWGNWGSDADDRARELTARSLVTEFRRIGASGSFPQAVSDGQRELVVFQKISNELVDENHTWYLVILSLQDRIFDQIYGLAKEIVILGVAMIMLAMLAGIWVARAITVPLRTIARSADGLVNADLDFTAAVVEPIENGPRELVILSHALSRAVGHIASRTHDLELARGAAESARRDAERSSSARAAFLAIMSHEIRTPLNGILGMIQLLQMNPDLTGQQSEYLDLARNAGESLLQILTDVLDLSKIESEEFTVEEVEFTVSDVITPVISIFRQTSSDSIAIHHNCMIANDLRLFGDPVRIRQIMWNLIGNAVKFTPEGSVNIESRINALETPNDTVLSVTISDTGIGIKDEDREKILEPFNQADTSITRPFEGVGLGLTIVQKLLSAMNGKLTIASIFGKGTVVNVEIPIKALQREGETSGTENSNAHIAESLNHSGAAALVVDDNKLNATVTAEMLKNAGLRAFVATGGREALEILCHQDVDYVVLDQHMPVMDGMSTAAAIRSHANKRVSDVNIIGLTADVRASNKNAMKQAGMNIVLTKPVRHETLLIALKNLPVTRGGRTTASTNSGR